MKCGRPGFVRGHPLLDYIRVTRQGRILHKHRIRATSLIVCNPDWFAQKRGQDAAAVMLDAREKKNAHFPACAISLYSAAPTIPGTGWKSDAKIRHQMFVSVTRTRRARRQAISRGSARYATLESGLIGTRCATYKLNTLTFILIRALIRIPYIGLVKSVAGKKIAQEVHPIRL
jgi:hypothetical protein